MKKALMESIVMVMPVLKEEENIWRIYLMPELEHSLVRSLVTLQFMMVCNNINSQGYNQNFVSVCSNMHLVNILQ